MANIFNWGKFVEKYPQVLSSEYEVLSTKLVGGELTLKCKAHGEFSMRPALFAKGVRCVKCWMEIKKSRSLDEIATNGTLIVGEFTKVHGDKYDYSKVEYTGALNKVEIICPKHGSFFQIASSHKVGHGCKKCADATIGSKTTLPHTAFLTLAKAVHGTKYTYDNAVFQGYAKKLSITCVEHGSFSVSAGNFLSGKGCAKCGSQTRGIRKDPTGSAKKTAITKVKSHAEFFVARAREIHGGKYEYSNSTYVGMRSNITIRCPTHGEFTQKAGKHLYHENGCPKCGNTASKPEAEIAAFLSSFTTVVSRDRTIIAPKELDIYLPELNIAVEYCGAYWHSHGSKEDETANKLKHYNKYQMCLEKGIRLITIFEDDWHQHKGAMKRFLRFAIGKGRGKLMARKCSVIRVATEEASTFFDVNHPQGGAGYGDNYALVYKAKMVACMRFTHGANDRGATDRMWTLSRYASSIQVVGGASKLLKAFESEHPNEAIKSFSDNRLFTGGMYEKLGFELVQDSQPDYKVWGIKSGVVPKSKYQRRNIQRRLIESGSSETFDHMADPRTEQEMTFLMGARRIYDCGKKTWVKQPEAKNDTP